MIFVLQAMDADLYGWSNEREKQGKLLYASSDRVKIEAIKQKLEEQEAHYRAALEDLRDRYDSNFSLKENAYIAALKHGISWEELYERNWGSDDENVDYRIVEVEEA